MERLISASGLLVFIGLGYSFINQSAGDSLATCIMGNCLTVNSGGVNSQNSKLFG